jgi:hypothetical protein
MAVRLVSIVRRLFRWTITGALTDNRHFDFEIIDLNSII